ncbi:hypothetical protein M1N64_02140, partial [Peptococcaceae bacterium]|nr:hypothetical protein [Peptococcaceae bacterium]
LFISKMQGQNEERKLLNKMFEKHVGFIEDDAYASSLESINTISNSESADFERILLNNKPFSKKDCRFLYKAPPNSPNYKLRNINTFNDLKKLLLIYTSNHNSIDSFIEDIKKIFSKMLFDTDINSSLNSLSDGFELRKNEISYHLYCIEKEIPEIMEKRAKSYQEIGRQMSGRSIPCSPERNRQLVDRLLTKFIDGIKVKCELHTKMKSLSSKPPDRIYFCPSLPNTVKRDNVGKIYIYKITAHV